MDAELDVNLRVKAIYPESLRGGRVRFSATIPLTDEELTIDMTYEDADTIDEGVKEAAKFLAVSAHLIAEQAAALAK